MKRGIRRILILFMGCALLAALSVTLNPEATTGHDGTTKVIARISPPQTDQSTEPVSEDSEEESTEESSPDSPAPGTGAPPPTIPVIAAAVSLLTAVAAAGGSRRGQHKSRRKE